MTAVRVGLSSRRLCQLAVVVLLAATACAATATPLGGKGDASETRTAPLSPTPAGGKGGSPPPIAGIVVPSVHCTGRPGGAPMVLVGDAIYEIADPVRPRLLCSFANTRAHLYTGDTFEYIRRSGDTGTEVVLHSIGSGNERVVAGWPIKLLDDRGGVTGDWMPDGNSAESLIPGIDGAGRNVLEPWVFAQGTTSRPAQYLTPAGPQDSEPVLAFSADGRYIVSGWAARPSRYPLEVYEIGRNDPVQLLDPADSSVLWSKSGHVLYIAPSPTKEARSWSPETGFQPIALSTAWQSRPSLSPDGTRIVFAAKAASSTATEFTVDMFDLHSQTQAALPLKSSSPNVTFVNDGWLWYAGVGPAIFALDLSTGASKAVVFGPGEAPSEISPAQFWPDA